MNNSFGLGTNSQCSSCLFALFLHMPNLCTHHGFFKMTIHLPCTHRFLSIHPFLSLSLYLSISDDIHGQLNTHWEREVYHTTVHYRTHTLYTNSTHTLYTYSTHTVHQQNKPCILTEHTLYTNRTHKLYTNRTHTVH